MRQRDKWRKFLTEITFHGDVFVRIKKRDGSWRNMWASWGPKSRLEYGDKWYPISARVWDVDWKEYRTVRRDAILKVDA